VFVPGKLFQTNLMFAGEARPFTRVGSGITRKHGANTPAYHENPKNPAVKSFEGLAPAYPPLTKEKGFITSVPGNNSKTKSSVRRSSDSITSTQTPTRTSASIKMSSTRQSPKTSPRNR